MSFVLGVDGGNSKTIALLARLDGTIVGTGRGGCADIYNASSVAAALAEIDIAVTAALKEADVDPGAVVAGAFSLAGADWPEDIQFLRTEMQGRGYGHTVTVVNDAVGALRAGLDRGVGVVVSCGTGTAIAARAADGLVWHASFWLEAQGSHALGERALRAVYRAELGIDPPTALSQRVLAFYEQRTVEDLLHLFTARLQDHPRNVPQLARLVLDTASEGDGTASSIVVEQGALLGDYALAAARKVGIADTPFPLVLAGGLFRHPSRLLATSLLQRVQADAPAAWVLESRFEPVVGALLLALEVVGVPIEDGPLARLAASMPPAPFFAT